MRVLTVLSCLVALSCGSQPEQAPSPQPPNIVLIMADDLGYNDIGANGSQIIHTPNIDALARDGIRATDGYVAAAVCSPSRAGLYTGRYQTRFGHEFNPSGRDTEIGMPLDQRTIAQMLKDAGYVTGLIGKWHLGKKREYHPLNRGFDEYFGMLAGGSSYIDSRKEGVSSWPAKNAPTERPASSAIFDGFERVQVDDYLTDVFAAKAVDFIDRHKDERFFLMLTPNAPHTPLQATEEYVERYPEVEGEGRRIFSAMVSAVDDYVGDVTAALANHGLEENTLVVFLSDNGCVKYLSEDVCSNDPLSGSKRFHLEGGIRIPYLLKWPAKLPKGSIYSDPIISLDLFSTFAAAAGSDERSQDGVNLLPYLRGETAGAPHEYLFWRAKPNMAVRWGKWKMWKVNKSNQKLSDLTVAGERLPEVDFPQDSPLGQLTVLYDLSADISEQKNLADEHPEIVKKLDAELERWNAELADPLWASNRSTLYELEGQIVQLFF
ncbi:MAG: sulfatase-like hydrolase/transferase [Bryobacterales bacterium]